MKRIVLALLVLLLASAAYSQNIQNTRWGVNKYVRDLVNETDTVKYLPDSTLDRIIHYAHRTTLLAMGQYTNVDTATIMCVAEQNTYLLPTNAISGQVVSVQIRREDASGKGEIGLVEVDPELTGKLGEGVKPNSYFINGGYIVLGTTPFANDTLNVHYVPVSNNLDTDTATVQVATEDLPAVAYLAASHVYLRDHQLQLGQMYFQMWQALISLKKPPQAAPQP